MPTSLPPATVDMIAARFRAMGEPMRLRLLMALQAGERNVTDLVKELSTSQANISKHLGVLASVGLLSRRKQGLNVYYAIADPSIFNMCEMVCGSLKKHLDAQSRMLS